jgi:hypothetical protein
LGEEVKDDEEAMSLIEVLARLIVGGILCCMRRILLVAF